MNEDKSTVQTYAMRYGTCMGIYWIMKFCFFPLGLKFPFLELVFMVLTLAVPILGYIYAKRYRDRACAGNLPFFKALAFCFMMYVYASILVAVAHLVYFQFIDNGFVFDAYGTLLQESAKMEGMQPMVDSLKEALDLFSGMSAIQLTMQFVFQNVFYGSLLAFPTALLVMRRKPVAF